MRAQNTTEYGLLIAAIALATLVAGVAFGPTLRTWFDLLIQRVTSTGGS